MVIKMKKIYKYIISMLTSAVLVFNAAFIPALNVQASSTGMLYGLSALLESLLLSAGMSCMGYSSVKMDRSDDSFISLKEAMSMGDTIKECMAQLDELDASGELEKAAEGDEFVYDNLKITKSKNGYKLHASKGLVSEAAKAIRSWAESDENICYEAFDSEDLSYVLTGDSTCYHSSFHSSVDSIATYESISDIDSFFGEFGLSDYLFSQGISDSSHYLLGWRDGSSISFYVVPLDMCFMQFDLSWLGSDFYGVYVDNSYYSFLSKQALRLSSSDLYSYVHSHYELNTSYMYSVTSKTWTVSENRNYRTWLQDKKFTAFNYKNAVNNGSYIAWLGDSQESMVTYTYDTKSSFISKGSGSKYANTEDFVSMDFDATTAESLASYSSLAEYMAYAASLSEQLSGIKDAIEDSTEQNAAQAKEIVSSINAQTDTLSDGIADVITTVKVQTDAINDVLEATKEQTDAIGDVITGIDDAVLAITDPLEDILEAVRDIAITIPSDLTLTIPEEKLNITVQVPDISTEVINNIEVKHDYPALQKTIAAAIAAPLEAAFVPDEDKVYVFVDDFHHKFGFVDDMKKNVENIQKYIFGVTPSPILKIPIMKVKSEYDYGFGDYFIIDISWYEPYRPYGDLIILAFAWLMFIWRVFVSLPGIISGAPGSIWSSTGSMGTQPGIGMNDANLIEDKRRK